jgi:hypothetical protein
LASLPLRLLLESWSTVFSKVEFAAENFFLAKENAHLKAERDQGKGYLS